jgi:hypothetical protein
MENPVDLQREKKHNLVEEEDPKKEKNKSSLKRHISH